MEYQLSAEAQQQIDLYQIPLVNPPLHINEDNSKKPFILIRHGFSMQNLQEKEAKYNNPNWTYDQVQGLEDMFTNEKYLDSSLHEIGIFQCVEQQKNVNQFKFHTVFISPLRRTIQTCLYLFATHPDRSEIKFVLLPQLAECLCSSGCFSAFTLTSTREDMEDLASRFQITLDYTRVSELGESWQIKVLENEEIVTEILQKIDQCDECGNKQPYHKVVLNQIRQTKNFLIESWSMLFKKSKKALDILQNQHEEYKNEQMNLDTYDSKNKIGVVSHGYLMKCMTAAKIEEDGSVEGRVLENVEMLPMSFE